MMTKKSCIVTTIKASLIDTLSFVNYHLNLGIDHIYLFFDDPEDPALGLLSKHKKVTCFRCDLKYWSEMKLRKNLISMLGIKKDNRKKFCLDERQQLNANLGFELSRRDGYDWIMHIDSDELIYSVGLLNKNLKRFESKYDVLRLPSMEAVPEKLSYQNIFRELSLFKSFGFIARFYYSHKKLLQKIIPNLKKNEGKLKLKTMYFNGNAAGKSIVLTSADIKNIGIHEPVAKEGHRLKYGFPNKIFLLHFECKSFEDWKKKWISVCKNPSDTIGYKEGSNLFLKELFVAHKDKNLKEMQNIYKKNYFIPLWKRLALQSCGLLRRVRLNKNAFKGSFFVE